MKRFGIVLPTLAGFGGMEKYALLVAVALSERHQVDVICGHPVDVLRLQETFGLELERLRFVCDNRAAHPSVHPNPWRARLQRWQATHNFAAMVAGYDVAVTHSMSVPVRSPVPDSVLICHFPMVKNQRIRPESSGREQRDILRRLDSWRRVVTSSHFAAGWIERYWRRPADVVHPFIRPAAVELDAKKSIMLGVGFFNPPQPPDPISYKRQETLIASFVNLCQAGLCGWELHLAGHALTEQADVRQFLEKLQEMAVGYPVHLHPNCSGQDLRNLYASASVFWHAAGHGVDAEATPERLEHFGMVTVEAMSWGCVPVAINLGGQTEIIEHERSGYLWTEQGELERYTRILTEDGRLRRRLAEGAVSRAAQFSEMAFRRRVLELF